jgi:2-hydroxy-6-oxonona-2,4-dienedioate hydrolase
MRRKAAVLIGIGVAAVLALASAAYVRDMNRAYDRIRARGSLLPTRYGDIQYTERGSGPAVLVIHGSGGGYDQGELLARAVLDDCFRAIMPSRFGYLRSTFHAGATFDDQAHAYAALLDALGVERVAVMALSHGGPSALLFALLHPERVTSLTLISAGVAPSADPDQAGANRRGDMLMTIFRYDPLYWGISKLFRRQLMGVMGADRAVVASLTPGQRRLVDEVIDGMNPVAPRSAGATFDNGAALPGPRISGIRAPTLIFHAEDDALQLFHNAAFAAAHIPRARLVRFNHGGHLVLSVEQATIRTMVQQHVLAHGGPAAPAVGAEVQAN